MYKKTFLFFALPEKKKKNRFCSRVNHYRKNELTLRVYSCKKRLPSSACSSETVEGVKCMLTRENEVRERIPVPHDNYFQSFLVRAMLRGLFLNFIPMTARSGFT